MTPEQAAAEAKPSILELGTAFSNDPTSLRRAREMGLTGWSFYIAGRGGVLGNVRADTVSAAMGFISPSAVRDGWDAACQVASPLDIAEQSLRQCCRWGNENLADFPQIGRLVELAERVVIHAESAAMPLFAAWRAMPIPEDSPQSRAAVVMYLMSEHRTGAHLIAIRACALSPLEAIVSGTDGIAGATAFGWQPPYPVYEPLIRKRAWAEAMTDRIAGEAYTVLDRAERCELVRLLGFAMIAVSRRNTA